jgi:hypothetical protein
MSEQLATGAALLSADETGRLAELEHIVDRGMDAFVEVGQALAEIRDRRLYRATHRIFEDYCRDRWGFGRTRAHRLIEAAEIVEMLPIGNTPANEAQARELVPLKDDEQAVVEAWRDARDEAAQLGQRLTAKIVTNAVQKRVGRIKREQLADKRRNEIWTCSACGHQAIAGHRDGWSFRGVRCYCPEHLQPLPPPPVKPPGSAEEEARLRIEVCRCECEYEDALAMLDLRQDELRWYRQDHAPAPEAEVDEAMRRMWTDELLELVDGCDGPIGDLVRRFIERDERSGEEVNR